MKILSKFKEYRVDFQDDVSFLLELHNVSNSFFVIDETVYQLYNEWFGSLPQDRFMVIRAVEQNKTIDTALSICDKMIDLSAKRNSVLISIGGGIIQDITGFVASVLYRGIRWIFVPTTLLSACDSCIGGKSSLNYKHYKNLLGTFYPPDQIYICPEFFRTLSRKDFLSGLGEVVKFNLMKGAQGVSDMRQRLDSLLRLDGNALNQCVRQSLLYKKSFIEADEFDKGERIKLNYAHTFGHAIEVISEYKIPHGTAVAVGMIIANRISVERGILSKELAISMEQILLQIIEIDLKLLFQDFDRIISVIRKDKKQIDEQITCVLLQVKNDAASLLIVHDVAPDEIRRAFDYFIELYRKKQ